MLPWTRTIPLLFAASLLVTAGMWLKRYIIVLPSLSVPRLEHEWGIYSPTLVEITIVVASFAAFALIFTLFSKLFPIVPLWEMQQGWREEQASEPTDGARVPALAFAEGGRND